MKRKEASFFLGEPPATRHQYHENAARTAASCCLAPSLAYNNNTTARKPVRKGKLPEGERLLIDEMNSLSIVDRQKVYEEIHGVMDQPVLPETEALIEEALQKMKKHLAQPSYRKREAYDRAAFLVPHRVHDRSFLLKFLRKEEYNAAKAATLLRRFMEFSYQFFGMNGILRDVRVRDLDPDDMAALRTGVVQPLPGVHDRAGRPIAMTFSSLARYKHPQNVVRTVFYVFTSMLQEEAAQTKGIVIVNWNYGDYIPSVPPNMFVMAASLWSAMPVHVAAYHTCYDQISMVPLLELNRLTMGRNIRIRSRTHFGSRLESKYALLTYGIDPSTFPLQDMDGYIIHTSMLFDWIESQDKREQAPPTNNYGIVPSSKDILLGRGHPFRTFPGNLDLAQLVDQHSNTFQESSKHSRKALVDQIAYTLLEEQGRRVLKRTSLLSPWTLASHKEVLKKIDSTFRNKRLVDEYHQSRLVQGLD